MDITAAIDVAVGLVLMYLILSLLCTTINEFVASAFSLRANTLAPALRELIDNVDLKKLFDEHGMINGSKVAANGGTVQASPGTAKGVAPMDPKTNKALDPKTSGQPAATPPSESKSSVLSRLMASADPSYLSGRSVAMALIGSVDPTKPAPSFAEIEAAIKDLPDSNIRDAMLASLLEADGKIEKLRDSLASWFDGAMDRLSGVYKRDLQKISLLVGFLIAVVFNADSLSVGNKLWQDRSLAAVIAQSAPDFLKAHCTQGSCKAQPVAPPANDKGAAAAAGSPAAAAGQAADAAKPLELSAALANIKAVEGDLRGLPIGWAGLQFPRTFWTWVWFALAKLFGFGLTAAALMMGAPFWFDLLQKIMNLRGTGEKPAKSAPPQPTT